MSSKKRVRTETVTMSTQPTVAAATRLRNKKRAQYGLASRAPLYKPLRYRSSGVPEQMIQKQKYAETVRHTITSGFVQYVFSCNGIYDANISGSGHQPLYFDQMMALYNHYVVTASHIRITPATGTGIDLIVCAYIDDDATGTTTATTSWEKPGAHVVAGTPSSYKIPPIDLYWKSENAFGRDVMANSELHGTASANPTEQSYFITTLFDPALGTTTNVTFLYECWFDIIFFERKDIGGS